MAGNGVRVRVRVRFGFCFYCKVSKCIKLQLLNKIAIIIVVVCLDLEWHCFL